MGPQQALKSGISKRHPGRIDTSMSAERVALAYMVNQSKKAHMNAHIFNPKSFSTRSLKSE